MVEFKKIYELGLNQLEKFINKLDEEGKDLQTWDIDYYVQLLLNGPLGAYATKLAENKKYFTIIPDVMGTVGNNAVTTHNTTSLGKDDYPLGVAVETYNNLPKFIQNIIPQVSEFVENVFRSGIEASTVIDNTLPIIDKAPQKRFDEESKGLWVKRSNASYLVKDSYYRLAMKDTRSLIFDKVKEFLGEEHFRIWADRKRYNPFDSDYNTATGIPNLIEKVLRDGENEETIRMDTMGNVLDSEEKRKASLKVTNPEKDEEFVLNAVEGQLGN